jgi:tyrosine-protein kinase Etk/Wzc
MGRLSITEAQQRRTFFENKLVEAKAELALSDKALRSTGISANTLKSSPLAAVEVVAKLKGAITAQEIKIGGMRGYLTESAPEINQALVELNILRNQLTKAAKDDPPIAVGSLQDSYVERFRDYKYKETLYEMFAKQFELARVDEAREGAVIQVIDPAQVPERKTKPKKAIIAIIATLAVGFSLLLFVFIRQSIRNSRQNSESAKKLASIQASWRRALFKT